MLYMQTLTSWSPSSVAETRNRKSRIFQSISSEAIGEGPDIAIQRVA